MYVHTVHDEGDLLRAGMADALAHRLNPAAPLSSNGRRFRAMTLIEIARELLEACGVSTRGLSRFELAGRALHHRSALGTADFPEMLANVGNKRLSAAYAAAPRSFVRWAREAPRASDFKPITVVSMSGAPELLQVNEHGEFQYGTVAARGETYQLVTYGRIVSLTRQAIVNDDLRGFDRLMVAGGRSAARLENALVYAQLTDNPTMADDEVLFSEGHANVGEDELDLTALGAARRAIRVQTGINGEPLALYPSFLVVPAALEQTAYQLTSAAYTPATVAGINEFREGGRAALEPVIEPLLDSASPSQWYALAAPGTCDTLEFCYLGDADGPTVEQKFDFSTDGLLLKIRHDFAAKAIDWRGAYRGGPSE